MTLPPERLHRIIRYLCRWHPEWGTVDGAHQQCRLASHELRRWLDEIKYPCRVATAPVERLFNPHPRWNHLHGREDRIRHYVVQHHAMTIDFTLRQFDSDAPFPCISIKGSHISLSQLPNNLI